MKFLLQTLEKPAMNVVSRISSAAALMLVLSAPAAIAQSYNFTFTGNDGIDATGTITISGTTAVSGSINVINVPLEAPPHTPLTTAFGDLLTAGGDVRDLDGDVITYDTVAYPSPANPIFDGTGVAFGSSIINGNTSSAAAASDGGTPVYDTVINLWGNSPNSYSMFIGEANPADLNPDGTLIAGRDAQWVYVYDETGTLTLNTLTPVPEPTTDALVLCGLAVGFLAIRRRATA